MTGFDVSQVLARANASLVEPDLDVTGALVSLLLGAIEVLPTAAAAILVELDDSMEVLAATSHRTNDLEVYQRQVDEGPCLEALRSGRPVGVVGRQALCDRWSLAGPAIVAAGYQGVEAMPLRWHGKTFGALNLFRTSASGFQADLTACRAIADAATLVVVAGYPNVPPLAEMLRAALEERTLVERAKGALACSRSTSMPEAYDALVDLARAEDVSLGVAARRVMERARTGRLERP